MMQWVKALVAKLEDMNLMAVTHCGRRSDFRVLLSDFHMLAMTHVCVHYTCTLMHTHTSTYKH